MHKMHKVRASYVPDETAEPTYDAIRFRSLAHQQHFFEWVQNRTPNVELPFQLHSTEFPHITAEIERRGWHYLCNPIQGKLGITLLREFYANTNKSKRERALNPPVYISRIRGKDLNYSPESLKRHDLKPTVRAWLDFVRRSLMPTSNANEVTVERAVLIHSIMEGLSIKAELLISKNISAAAESKDPNKRLPFTGVVYRLLFANGFKKKVQGDELIPIEKPITAEMHHQVHEERDQQEQHFQPPPQQFDFPQPPPQNFPQEYNWQELTQQFQGMRVEQNNQFKDFFDRQNSFFEEMHTQTKAYKQGFEDMRVQQHKYVEEIKASQEITHKAVLELRENQNKHINDFATHKKEINSKNEQKIDYLCWGVQQVNPYLKGRLPEDIPEWMQANLQAGRGRFHDGMSRIPRDCWRGATSRGPASTPNEEDKGKGKAEEGDNDERGKKKAWEARDKDLNQ
ncbi:hypothetical protein PIB30_037666 [Stylosanthes scabra]|uniref:Putative plant transposon protein domain-containing protein n=1 Tax=Stylosanthes scabra TaxID=79078 RepID=A0ABU6UGJ0_9FABA|nr:hypothetical protein [Stylosanthes scabra]